MERHVLNHGAEVERRSDCPSDTRKMREEDCGFMAQAAKFEALIYESDRRMALLDALQEHAEGLSRPR